MVEIVYAAARRRQVRQRARAAPTASRRPAAWASKRDQRACAAHAGHGVPRRAGGDDRFAQGDVVRAARAAKGRCRRPPAGHDGARLALRPTYFDSVDLPRADLTHLLRSKAVLMPGVTVTLTVEKSGETQQWLYKGGLRDYLMQNARRQPLVPLLDGEQYATGAETENVAEARGAAWCVAIHRGRRSGARELRQPDSDGGGRHARAGPEGRPVRRDPRASSSCTALLPKGVKLMPDDVFSRAVRALGQGAGSAVPGPDQGAAEQPRRAAPGQLRQAASSCG